MYIRRVWSEKMRVQEGKLMHHHQPRFSEEVSLRGFPPPSIIHTIIWAESKRECKKHVQEFRERLGIPCDANFGALPGGVQGRRRHELKSKWAWEV